MSIIRSAIGGLLLGLTIVVSFKSFKQDRSEFNGSLLPPTGSVRQNEANQFQISGTTPNTNPSLQDVVDTALQDAELAASYALFDLEYEAKYKGNPEGFIQLQWRHGVDYESATSLLSKDDAPELRRLLGDVAYTPYWSNLIHTLGFIDQGEESAKAIIDHIKRPFDIEAVVESQRMKVAREVILSKVIAPMVLGRLNRPEYNSMLLAALEEKGPRPS